MLTVFSLVIFLTVTVISDSEPQQLLSSLTILLLLLCAVNILSLSLSTGLSED